MNADEKIKAFRDKGYTDDQIRTYFRTKFKELKYSDADIEHWLVSKKLREEKLEAETFGDQLSRSFRGFGRDVLSGVASGLTLAKMGTGPIGQAVSLPVSYVGGWTGQGIEDMLRGEQPKTWSESLSRYNEAGMKSLKDELAGGTVAKLLAPVAKPFSNRMNYEDFRISDFARENKLSLPASAIAESKPARALEWVGDSLTFGKTIGDMRRNKLKNNLEKLLEATKAGLTEADKSSVGMQFADGLKQGQAAIYKKTAEAYKEFGRALKEEIGDEALNMPNFIQAAEKWPSQVSLENFPKLRQFLAEIGDRAARGDKLTGKEIDMYQKQIWSTTYPKNAYIGGELWEALEKDLDIGNGNVWNALQEARQANKIKKTWHQNPVVRATPRRYRAVILTELFCRHFAPAIWTP